MSIELQQAADRVRQLVNDMPLQPGDPRFPIWLGSLMGALDVFLVRLYSEGVIY